MPGAYLVGSKEGTVAICTLASEELPAGIMAQSDPSLALVGKCLTENIGIEKIISNVIATPSIRWLILCGEESRGHRSGEALVQLKAQGVDAAMRIHGATSWRPVLKNLNLKEVSRFRRQVSVINHIGTSDPAAIGEYIRECATLPVDPLEPYQDNQAHPGPVKIKAYAPTKLQLDPAGFFIVLLDRARETLICEHYTNDGTLNRVIEGDEAALVAATVVEQGLISRLDHAAYLGRELAKAEQALRSGASYRQDAALGEMGKEAAEINPDDKG